ncbi:MAG: hypothetical protein EAZ60_17710 [Oscillatoriales cyanobacterium]|uniref:hypothetical protein n=1 Tax=Microcoleus sp. PH2017_22_RUC_O_B TaxID=2798833 RepID=UPI001D295775|nr:hypothetical protein [Microcoleus sp. PH2017_22_RUC_O_B]MCC3459508.1 hypothetical protein [Microcoleus sp. PH2017_11_PCY_U_A]MCC3558861.1 hypothetical protein [Microcoleus sp. PH2017_27_LUM_O_A]TAE84196.1 MAG: hypothetical protein EAZ83_07150 [Oscillatoriales cyanobacterium]TAE97682.1 MAG: hypothetical protein EAZ79_10020 [Oscillatoriales cyanobacterium]TAF21872.1 MAG: hypothetical protein EAZ73_07515 [Oscillatoriales cyanobacterium]
MLYLTLLGGCHPVKHFLKESKQKCLKDKPGMLLLEMTRFGEKYFTPKQFYFNWLRDCCGRAIAIAKSAAFFNSY